MLRTKVVYELNKVTDDPRFEGFALDWQPSLQGFDSLDEDFTPGFADAHENPVWVQSSLKNSWKAPVVSGRVAEFNDYPALNLIFPVFSERAVKGIGDMLTENGELLPLLTDTETKYFFFNILNISSALVVQDSKCNFWCDPPTTAVSISHYEFNSRLLVGLSIFRIHQLPNSVFVTDSFVDRVRSLQLHGFDFKPVWTLESDGIPQPNGREEYRKASDSIKQHSLVLVWNSIGQDGMNDQIRKFEDRIDARLRIGSLEDDYFGCYQGYEFVKDEFRMFFSCPDVDKLFAFLESDIRETDFGMYPNVCRRYGEISEPDAVEKWD